VWLLVTSPQRVSLVALHTKSFEPSAVFGLATLFICQLLVVCAALLIESNCFTETPFSA
jgi:hypothetical protein